ncbi:MAG: hypothetical protein Q7K39_03840 [Candidatus Magasanikbacteria bacterium]|nr:hypothetical protein [Candidatus Magasanikbacteria bacterium]
MTIPNQALAPKPASTNEPVIIEPKEILGIINLDHPGAHDPEYRERREHIATLAKQFRANPRLIPELKYTEAEHETWSIVANELERLHGARACEMYLEARPKLKIPIDHIPQMEDLNRAINRFQGMRLAPVEGLVDSRSFLSQLGNRVMMCTQYVRHHSRPTFTPEPDVIHEFLGHVPTFANKELVEFSQLVGRAAKIATEDQLKKLERLYWFTLEYGLIQEGNGIKAFGAGLLAGIEDMNNAFKPDADIREFSVDEVVKTEYNYSILQPTYFVIPSFEFLRDATKKLLDTF